MELGMDKEEHIFPTWWHQDHNKWIKEVAQWQHESDRLVALLYQVELALPEHTAMLNNHVMGIEQHDGYIQEYENGILQFTSIESQQEYHHNLSQLHAKMKKEHAVLKQRYLKEMERFKVLVSKLLGECT